jgi:hypothetical protein
MMYLALTYDHRLLDGREAVTFLVKIKVCLEHILCASQSSADMTYRNTLKIHERCCWRDLSQTLNIHERVSRSRGDVYRAGSCRTGVVLHKKQCIRSVG